MKQSFLEHLQELRDLVVKCALVLILGCIIVACTFSYFAELLYYPLKAATEQNSETLQGLVTTSPMGIFSVLMQVCFLGGLAISLPVMIYFIAKFISPGLSIKEKSVLIPACFAVLGLFTLGASFSYFYVIPASLKVAISLNKTFGFQLIWSAPAYYGLIVWMTLGIGLCFEFPLAILLLVYFNLVSTEKLKSIRRHMIVGTLLAGAIITPTGDPLSLALISIPLYIMYEIAIVVGRKFEKKQTEVEKEEELPWPVDRIN